MSEGGDLAAFLSLLWRSKVVIILTVGLVLGAAVGLLLTAAPTYRSTSTLAVVPDGADSVALLSQINVVVSLYAEGARGQETLSSAASVLGARRIPKPNIRTSTGTPLLFVEASSRNRHLAQARAQAVSKALLQRADAGAIGIPGLKLVQLDEPAVPSGPTWPHSSAVLAVGAVAGILLGLLAAFAREAIRSQRGGHSLQRPAARPRVAGPVPIDGSSEGGGYADQVSREGLALASNQPPGLEELANFVRRRRGLQA